MPIQKIISGGQTGADRAALDAAIQIGLSHGGWVPKGRMAEDGRVPAKYNLKEMPTKSYPKCTEQNIVDSDGTVIISHGPLTGGSKHTQDLANGHKLPCLHIDVHQIPQVLAATKINEWVIEHDIEVLNVAGSRASGDPEIYEDTWHIIEGAILLSIVAEDPEKYIQDYTSQKHPGKLPVPPKTVDDAVYQLVGRMTLKDRVTIAKMGMDDMVQLHRSMGRYIIDTFRLPHNDELMASCRSIATELVIDEDHAAVVILGALRRELYQSHRSRVVQ